MTVTIDHRTTSPERAVAQCDAELRKLLAQRLSGEICREKYDEMVDALLDVRLTAMIIKATGDA